MAMENGFNEHGRLSKAEQQLIEKMQAFSYEEQKLIKLIAEIVVNSTLKLMDEGKQNDAEDLSEAC
jgi:hypothetical protein